MSDIDAELMRAELFVTASMVRALTLTHPEPAALERHFQTIVDELLTGLSNPGGPDVSGFRNLVASRAQEALRWIRPD